MRIPRRTPTHWLTIPECRDLLLLLADDLQRHGMASRARVVRRIVLHLWRRPAARVTSVKSRPITPAMKASMRTMAATTDLSQAEIGRLHGTNGGRVSEAIAGKRR